MSTGQAQITKTAEQVADAERMALAIAAEAEAKKKVDEAVVAAVNAGTPAPVTPVTPPAPAPIVTPALETPVTTTTTTTVTAQQTPVVAQEAPAAPAKKMAIEEYIHMSDGTVLRRKLNKDKTGYEGETEKLGMLSFRRWFKGAAELPYDLAKIAGGAALGAGGVLVAQKLTANKAS